MGAAVDASGGHVLPGLLLLFVASVCTSVTVTISTLTPKYSMSFDLLAGSAAATCAKILLTYLFYTGALQELKAENYKWVFLRGFFSASAFACNIAAAYAGAPVGDIMALNSVNIVVAALLGYIFMQEELGFKQIVSMCLSITGVVLVSQPHMQNGSLGHGALYGCLWATLSGAIFGAVFLACRKASKVDTLILTASALVQQGWFILGMYVIRLATHEQSNFLDVASLSKQTVLWLLLGVLLISKHSTVNRAAQYLCTGTSATIFSTFNILVGYSVQVGVHGGHPAKGTLAGAGLLIASIVIMAMAQHHDAEDSLDEAGMLSNSPPGTLLSSVPVDDKQAPLARRRLEEVCRQAEARQKDPEAPVFYNTFAKPVHLTI